MPGQVAREPFALQGQLSMERCVFGVSRCSPRRARPVGAEGSQLHPAANAAAAPDGLAPSELEVRS
jgi:hypothetical protein